MLRINWESPHLDYCSIDAHCGVSRELQYFWQHVKAALGLYLPWLLPVREAQSAVTFWKARRGITGEEKHTRRAKMSSFSDKFSAYTMTELNEILEDDEKLTQMVQAMDEVC